MEINFSRSADVPVSVRSRTRVPFCEGAPTKHLQPYTQIQGGKGGGDDRRGARPIRRHAVSVRPAVNYPAVRTILLLQWRPIVPLPTENRAKPVLC